MQAFQDLYEFINRAVKSRKYPEGTAIALRSALKLYETELNEEERGSLEKFKSNFEQITDNVFKKNQKKYTDGSLLTYKSRVIKVLNEYQTYGTNPSKMVAWSPTRKTRTKKHAAVAVPVPISGGPLVGTMEATDIVPDNVHRIDLALRPGARVVIIIPRDMTKAEQVMIHSILDSIPTQE